MISGLLIAASLAVTGFALPAMGRQQPLAQHQEIRLWQSDAPGALGTGPADIPTLTVYLPDAQHATGAAIVVCPGGGYQGLADHEGRPIAEWLNESGITAFVLRYRLGPRYHHPVMMQDVNRAIRMVRAHASDWSLDSHRIGVLGFSAGGHLASTAATHYDAGKTDAADPVDRVSSRPDAAVLVYAVITMTDPFTHAGSRGNLLGPNPPADLITLMSNEKQVTHDTPPTFLMHTADDPVVPVENCLLFASALRAAGVPFEVHIYEHGPHGVGLAKNDPALAEWTHACELWLARRGFTKK